MNIHYDLVKTEIATRVRAAEQRRRATLFRTSREHRTGWTRASTRVIRERG